MNITIKILNQKKLLKFAAEVTILFFYRIEEEFIRADKGIKGNWD